MSELKPSQLISRTEIDNAYDKLHAENEKLRMLLWLRHGCTSLYGDDGEMQCGSCIIDFKRDTADSIEHKWYTENQKAIEEYMKQGTMTDDRTLIEKVQDAQVEAGEQAVMDNLKRMGF